MIGLRLVLTGAVVMLTSWAVAEEGPRDPPLWLAIPVVLGFFGGATASVVGLILAIWGI